MKTPDQQRIDALSALADMWNQYCPPPMGHAYMSAGEDAEEVLAAAGLMGADGVASFPPEPPAPRPLSSLTEAECAELYRLAFGQDAQPMKFYAASHMICISDPNWYTLILYADGNACPERSYSSESTAFNLVKVLRYLDSLGIALG